MSYKNEAFRRLSVDQLDELFEFAVEKSERLWSEYRKLENPTPLLADQAEGWDDLTDAIRSELDWRLQTA